MAQFVSDISDGNPLSRDGISEGDTVSLVATPSEVGGQSLRVVLDGGFYFASWNVVPSNTSWTTSSGTDGEVLALVRLSGASSTNVIEVYLGSDYYARLYRNQSSIFIRHTDDVASGSIGSTFGNDQWWWLRLRKVGAQLRAQAWLHGSSEPAGEAATYTFSGSWTGRPAIVLARQSLTDPRVDGTYYLDYIAFGTAGDPAPRIGKKDFYVRDGGVWKPVQTLSVRDGGVWKPVQTLSVRDGGVWKEIYS